MTRDLSERERAVLLALVERGSDPGGPPVPASARARWRDQVATARAGASCGCGTCPSIELTDAQGRTPGEDGPRVVLSGEVPGALVHLFVDEDRLSYLELSPLDDVAFTEFPPVTELSFS